MEFFRPQVGRQALFSWLGETKWSKFQRLEPSRKVREFFFIELLCKKSDLSKMTMESYRCFCEHFVRLNCDFVFTHFDNIEEVTKRDLLGKAYLWNIIILAPEKVSSKAMTFFLQLFHALKMDRDTERLAIMENFLGFIDKKRDGSSDSEANQVRRCFQLLQKMVKEDTDASDDVGIVRSHAEAGRGDPLRLTVSATPKNSDSSLPLSARTSPKGSTGATVDNLEQEVETNNIEFTIETHTNALLIDVRKKYPG